MIWMKNALTAGNNEDLLSSIGWQYKEVSGRTRVYNEGQACNAGHSPRAAVQHIKMQKSKDEIRKEKNRLSANLSYQKKKREREDLENKNRTLSNTQLSLHRDMRRLRKLARCYEAVLSEIVHSNTCTLSRPVDRHATLLPVSSSLAPQNHRPQPAKDESVPTAFLPASPVLRGGGGELPRVLDAQNKLGEETGVTLCSKPQQICMNVPNISLLSDESEWGQVASHSSPQGLGGKVLTPPSSRGSRFELTSRSSDPCDELNDFKFKSLPVPNPQRLPLLSTIPPTVPHFLVEFQASLRTDENFTSGFSSMTDVNQVFTTFNEKETEPRFREKSTNTPQPTIMMTSATTTMKTRNDGAANTWKAFPTTLGHHHHLEEERVHAGDIHSVSASKALP